MQGIKTKEIREQLREMDNDQLHIEIAAQRKLLFDYRRKSSMRMLEDTAAIRQSRRQIARALTILRERELKAKAQEGTN